MLDLSGRKLSPVLLGDSPPVTGRVQHIPVVVQAVPPIEQEEGSLFELRKALQLVIISRFRRQAEDVPVIENNRSNSVLFHPITPVTLQDCPEASAGSSAGGASRVLLASDESTAVIDGATSTACHQYYATFSSC